MGDITGNEVCKCGESHVTTTHLLKQCKDPCIKTQVLEIWGDNLEDSDPVDLVKKDPRPLFKLIGKNLTGKWADAAKEQFQLDEIEPRVHEIIKDLDEQIMDMDEDKQREILEMYLDPEESDPSLF